MNNGEDVFTIDQINWMPRALLYGRLYQDTTIEGLLCKSITPSLLSVVTAQTPWRGDSSSNVKLF